MYYIVNGVQYRNVEEAFNKYIEEFNSVQVPLISSYEDGRMVEIIRLEHAKLVYSAIPYVIDKYGRRTPLQRQYIGYVIKNAGDISKLSKEITKELRKHNISVDKYDFEDFLINYYICNSENVNSVNIDLNDYYITVFINNQAFGNITISKEGVYY